MNPFFVNLGNGPTTTDLRCTQCNLTHAHWAFDSRGGFFCGYCAEYVVTQPHCPCCDGHCKSPPVKANQLDGSIVACEDCAWIGRLGIPHGCGHKDPIPKAQTMLAYYNGRLMFPMNNGAVTGKRPQGQSVDPKGQNYALAMTRAANAMGIPPMTDPPYQQRLIKRPWPALPPPGVAFKRNLQNPPPTAAERMGFGKGDPAYDLVNQVAKSGFFPTHDLTAEDIVKAANAMHSGIAGKRIDLMSVDEAPPSSPAIPHFPPPTPGNPVTTTSLFTLVDPPNDSKDPRNDNYKGRTPFPSNDHREARRRGERRKKNRR